MKIVRFLTHEIKEIAGRFLYFFICFGFILLILKLFLDKYSIEFTVLSKAVLGALIAAKASVIVDKTGMSKRNKPHPRYLNVLYKTFLYTLIAAILGILESIIEAFSKTKVIAEAIETATHIANLSHFLAVMLLIALIFLGYNTFDEISLYMGEGKLKKFFFSQPKQ